MEKAFELAEREGAASYTPQIYREAKTALHQAKAYGEHTTRTKAILDFSRRAVSLASEAIQTTLRRKEREALERQIEERRREMEALEARARQAEGNASAAREQLADARLALAEAKLERAAADQAIAKVQQDLKGLEAEKATLRQEQQSLLSERDALLKQRGELKASVEEMARRAEKLRQEREQLASRLEGALSQVADTRSSARGLIVNLPDILFDIDKATLKPEARVVIAKLSGILLIMPELNLRSEGHTDSTGSEEHNQGLSERRAGSVKDFLAAQGIGINRMVAVGYGEHRPVADNSTKEGRQKNRRVEIVIAEGEVREAGQ